MAAWADLGPVVASMAQLTYALALRSRGSGLGRLPLLGFPCGCAGKGPSHRRSTGVQRLHSFGGDVLASSKRTLRLAL